jgi:integrase
MREKLTVGRIKAAMKRPGYQFLSDGAGLNLLIKDGEASWVYRKILDGREHRRGLGRYPDVPLSEARDKLIEVRRSVLNGTFLRPKGIDFATVAKLCHAAKSDGWRSLKHSNDWISTVERLAIPAIGRKRIDAIDVHDVLQVLKPLWARKRSTAQRLRGRIESVLDWAAADGHRSGPNPARWSGHLEHLLANGGAKVEHFTALPYSEVPTFVAELRRRDSLASRALQFTILTAARTGEVLGMTWPEIDFERAAVWVVPAARMKMGREHRVPLCGRALSILGDLMRLNDRVFPIGKNAMLELAGAVRPGITTHGFRSAFADWVTEKTDFPREVREMALAHAVGDKVEEAYRRGDLLDKRRQLMEAWADFCG